MKKKIFWYLGTVFLLLMVMAGAASAEGETEAFQLGNSSENILNGGTIASDENGRVFFFDEDTKSLCYYEENQKVVLNNDYGTSLNIWDGYIYYIVDEKEGSVIKKADLETGVSEKVLQTSDKAKQLYVVNGNQFYYLTGDGVVCYTLQDKESVICEADKNITSFIPTAEGIVYSKGSMLEKALYVKGSRFLENVSTYYIIDGYLIMDSSGKTFESDVNSLFSGNPADAVSVYDQSSFSMPWLLHGLNDTCSYCESVHTEVELAGASVVESDAVSVLSSVSAKQQNIVKRARQQAEIEWTALGDVSGWDKNFTFSKGSTYKGIPYGQPVSPKVYVPWDVSLDEFAEYTKDANSLMYTSFGSYGGSTFPYYSSDCSSFVSWAWDLAGRRTTNSLGLVADYVPTQSVYSVQVGDAFVCAGNHAVLVTDVGYDSSGTNIVYVDITEQTPPYPRTTRYGEGGAAGNTLSYLYTKYLQDNYILYRLKDKYSVSYTHNCNVPLDGETCEKCEDKKYKPGTPQILSLSQTSGGAITINWSQADRSDAYGIMRSESPDGEYSLIMTVAGNIFSYNDIGVTHGKVYYYKVYGAKWTDQGWINGDLSASASKKVVLDVPSAPSGLTVKEAENGLLLNWSATQHADAYGILKSNLSNGTYTWIASTGAPTYLDTDVMKGNIYYYKVYGSNYYEDLGWIDGSYSNSVKGVVTLNAPGNIRAVSGAGIHSIKLTWDTVDGTTLYGIMRSDTIDGTYEWIGATWENQYLDENLSSDHSYYYKIYSALLIDGVWYNGIESEPKEARVLSGPDGISIASQNGNALQINWNPVAGAAMYAIYRGQGQTENLDRISIVSGSSYVDTGLSVGATYYYVIQSLSLDNGQMGIGANSATVGARVIPGTPVITEVGPGAGVHGIKVSWTSVSGADCYGIWRSEEKDGTYEWINAVYCGVTNYTDTDRDPNKTYYYKVYASKASGAEWINGQDSAPVGGNVCPAPSYVEVISEDATSIRVSWSEVPGAFGYVVYRSESEGGAGEKLGITNSSFYNDRNLSIGKTYYYTIQTLVLIDGDLGIGNHTEQVNTITTLQTPSINSISSPSLAQGVTLSWNAVPGADAYGILRADKSTGEYVWLNVVWSTTYTDMQIEPSAGYYYKVYATKWKNDTWYDGSASEPAYVETVSSNMAHGLDVSRYSLNVDWPKVKNAGYEFAMIRIGYRRNADGALIEDPYARQNLQGALNAGMDVGVYFFSTAISEEEAVEEARWVQNYISGYNITYPVVYDCEGYDKDTSRMYGLSATQRTNHAVRFLDYIASSGYTPMMYGSKYHLVNSWEIERLDSNYQVWVAQWPVPTPAYPSVGESTYERNYKMWQYAGEVSGVPGVEGLVDLNVMFKNK
ncbi:GH25 family lysozyme [Qiania dongpingensis]|uniref:Fibronectin type-III domain-containing protein n=1 Tax=Qiania dongpingensis TaxID=2763669 RepID=A0A7G9G7T5_9FIRM|nr:GH25 family lysozyme [Qiania dongpingensis]QNM06867.1 hypothetical protein H9Q78_07090 [Qiania dongpingensis]